MVRFDGSFLCGMGDGKDKRQGRRATLRDTSQGVPDVTLSLISFFAGDNFTARIGRLNSA